MAKYERRIQRKLAARVKGCIEARSEAVKKSARLSGVIERAFRMPGSRRLRKH